MKRIVSLLPSATEILFAIGAGDQVIGVTHECDTPIEAASRPRLTSTRILKEERDGETIAMSIERQVQARLADGGSLYDLDETLLRELAPDIVVTQALCDVCAVSFSTVERIVARLQKIPVLISQEPTTLAEVEASVRQLGRAAGREAGAEAVVAEMRARIERVRATLAGRRRKRVVMLEWTDPPYGGGHWSADCVRLAGGDPQCAFDGAPSQSISWMDVIAADPEVVIIAPCGTGMDATLAAVDDLMAREPFWRAFAQSRDVVAIDGHHFANRPSPALARTIELFAAAIHPEAFELPPCDEFLRLTLLAR